MMSTEFMSRAMIGRRVTRTATGRGSGRVRRRCWPLLLSAAAALQVPQVFATTLWTPVGTVSYLEAMNDGVTFLLQTTGAPSSNCTTTAGAIYFTVGVNGVTADGFKAIMTIALSAVVSGKTVQIAYDDTGPTCYGKFIQINQ